MGRSIIKISASSTVSNPDGVKGKAFITEAMRPGVITIPHSLGHWQYGSKAFDLDGKQTAFRKIVGRGCSANPVMMLDLIGSGSL